MNENLDGIRSEVKSNDTMKINREKREKECLVFNNQRKKKKSKFQFFLLIFLYEP